MPVILPSWTNLYPQVLEAIEEELKSGETSESKLNELTSKFYTSIPHHFGRREPPVIRDAQTLQNKFDMLVVSFAATGAIGQPADQTWSVAAVSWQVLGDIEIAQGIERDKEKKQKEVCVLVQASPPSPTSLPMRIDG